MLRDAAEHFDIGIAKAESVLKSIGANITLAVIGCIRAACDDTNSSKLKTWFYFHNFTIWLALCFPGRQHGFLRAAYLGLCHLKSEKHNFNPWALCKARILPNFIRCPHYCFPSY